MSDLAILSIILFIGIVILSCFLYRENKEKIYYQNEELKLRALKKALEYKCNYPEVSTEELDEVTPLRELTLKKFQEHFDYQKWHRADCEAILSLYKRKQAIYKEILREQKGEEQGG